MAPTLRHGTGAVTHSQFVIMAISQGPFRAASLRRYKESPHLQREERRKTIFIEPITLRALRRQRGLWWLRGVSALCIIFLLSAAYLAVRAALMAVVY